MLQVNVGNIDRVLRVVLGLFLLSLVVVGPRSAWGLLGILPFISGWVGFCPIYRVFGFSTCHKTLPSH